MSDKLLVWFGDSWVYGSGLQGRVQNRLSSIIQDLLGLPTINCAQPGTSVGHLLYSIRKIERIRQWFPTKKIYAIFGLTSPYRLCIETYDGKVQTISHRNFDKEAFVDFGKDILSDHYVLKETCVAMSWLTHECLSRKIPFRFVNILGNYNDYTKSHFSKYIDWSNWLVSPTWSMYSELFNLTDIDFSKIGLLEKTSHGKIHLKKYFLEHDTTHPNKDGHQRLALKLYKEVDEFIQKR